MPVIHLHVFVTVHFFWKSPKFWNRFHLTIFWRLFVLFVAVAPFSIKLLCLSVSFICLDAKLCEQQAFSANDFSSLTLLVKGVDDGLLDIRQVIILHQDCTAYQPRVIRAFKCSGNTCRCFEIISGVGCDSTSFHSFPFLRYSNFLGLWISGFRYL